jgi:biotin carboxyl carrier protein
MSKQQPVDTRTEAMPPLEELEIGSARYKTRLTEKFKNRISWVRPDTNIVKAVIPGTIQKVMVRDDDEVHPGDPLVILEAMKMRNEVTSDKGGVIKKVLVKEGDLVTKEQVLVEFRD